MKDMADKVDVLAVLDDQIAVRDSMNAALGGNRCASIELRKVRNAIAELKAAAANVSERIAYYAELGENATPTIEDWAYTDQSGDVARLRAALAALEQQP